MAETFKETNVNTDEETTQPTDANRESQNLEHSKTAENPEVDKLKIEFYKALKEFEGTDPTKRYQIPKQKRSRKLASIITTVNQEILPEYLKYNVTNFELHNTIYAAAFATVRLSEARMDRQIDINKLNHTQNNTNSTMGKKAPETN